MSDKIKRLLTRRQPGKLQGKDLLSTGSTQLNLACSGRARGGIPKGIYVHVVGDSNSGKSWIVNTCLAEASINPNFDEYSIILDIPENGMFMDVAKYFGDRLLKRMKPCRGTTDEPEYSTTVEEFFDWVDARIKKGKPFIGVLDSFDALSSEAEEAEVEAGKEARQKGGQEGGTYGTGRAKANSRRMRKINNGLARTGSILFIISQTRDNIGFGSQLQPKTYAGGKALKFFCKIQLWTSIRETLKKKVRGKDRRQGILSKVKIAKNHITGREGEVEVPIYYSHGIDDTGSCIDYLVSEGYWKKSQGNINAEDFEFKGPREKLVNLIESTEGAPRKLRNLVSNLFHEIEAECAIKRKSKYHDAE
jgi:RecA/RadA recombinase